MNFTRNKHMNQASGRHRRRVQAMKKIVVGNGGAAQHRRHARLGRKRRAAEHHHLVLGRRLPEGAARGLVQSRRERARHHHQGGYDLRRRRHPRPGRLWPPDLGSVDAGRPHLRHPREGGQAREARSGHRQRRGRAQGPQDRLLDLADRLLHRHRLAHQGLRRQEAGRLGSLLGHQEFPGPALHAAPPDLQSRGGADRRRRADGQALPHRRRARLQEARGV